MWVIRFFAKEVYFIINQKIQKENLDYEYSKLSNF